MDTHAQGEYNNWIFGDSIWLDFNNGAPVVGTMPRIASNPAATISNEQGDLLFYVEIPSSNPWRYCGLIRDKFGNPMLNGDSISGVQGSMKCLILPVPCKDSLYYLFTFSSDSLLIDSLNLYYSIINMNQNNGLGAVTQKNILLDSNVTISMAATRHANNRDYWLTYMKSDTNIYLSRQITPNSITPPINSQIGPNANYYYSSLKFSNHSGYLVNAQWFTPSPIVMQFNNQTGLLSNYFTLTLPPTTSPPPPYIINAGSQFSQNDQILYLSGLGYIAQYDFSSNTPSLINSSVINILSQPSYVVDISLAPDGKIYALDASITSLSTINSPNTLGVGANYQHASLFTGKFPYNSLPTMLPNLFVHRTVETDSLLCQYDTINLYLSDTNYIDSLVWNFGDTLSTSNTSNAVVPLHVYNAYGTYPIEVIIYSGCKTDTIHDTIRINPTPIANLGPDTLLCEGDSMQLLFNDTSFNYLWSTTDTTLQIEILNADTYHVAISSICGTDYDTVVIDSIIPAFVHLPNDTLLCTGDSLLLDATIQNGTYQWSFTGTDSAYYIHNAGVYWATATNICGTDSDTIQIAYTHAPNINLGPDTALCVNDTLVLNAWDTLSTFLWSTGDTNALDTFTTSGTFWASASNLCGTDLDTLQAWFLATPTANLGNDTVLCVGDTLALSDTTLFGAYLWQNGASTDTAFASVAGQYWVEISTICGVASDTITLDFDTIPIVNLGPDTTICHGDSILLTATFSRSTYLWNTASTDSSIYALVEGKYWAIATNLCGTASDTMHLEVDSVLQVNLGPDTVLCPLDTLWLHSNVMGNTYAWSTNNTAPSIMVTTDNSYALSVTNTCGTYSDTIAVHYDAAPIINLGPDARYCLSNLVNLNAHWSRATYLWNTADTTPSITANFDGNYSVTVLNLCGFDNDSVTINYDIPINFELGPDTTICLGDSVQFAAPALNATWLWNNGSTDSTIWVMQNGMVHVSAQNVCGVFKDSLFVSVETPPVIAPAINDTTFCEGNSYEVVVNRNNANRIEWLDQTMKWNHAFDTNGTYYYTTYNLCGSTADTFNLFVEQPANANLGNDTLICYGEEIVKDFAYPGHQFEWSNGSNDSFLIITEPGLYGVTIYTPYNCVSVDEIEVISCDAQVFIPNAFTPNNDNHNDVFKVEAVGIKAFRLAIYNRWGQEIFETKDLTQGWDGYILNEPAPAAVYTYRVWYNTGHTSQSVTKTGTVTLVR